MIPTMNLRFVKRRVGLNVVRILQQEWIHDFSSAEIAPDTAPTEWRDVELADERATTRPIPKEGA